MRNATMRIALTAASLLVSSSALSQGVYGVASGLVVETYPNTNVAPGCIAGSCCGGVNMTVSAGTYWLNNTALALTEAQFTSGVSTWNLGGIVQGSGGPCGNQLLDVPPVAANTVYYCYETNNTQTPICSLTAPYLNGQPSAKIPANTGTQNMVFVGSVITDANKVFIPEHRVGERVVYRPTAAEDTTVSFTFGGVTYHFDGSIASCQWIGGGGACSLLPFYPATASAGLFDVHALSKAGLNVQGLISFLDPYPYLLPVGTKQIQAQIGIGGESGVGSPELETVRITLNANQINPPYSPNYDNQGVTNALGTLVTPSVDIGIANVAVVAVLRGIVEPVQRLSSR